MPPDSGATEKNFITPLAKAGNRFMETLEERFSGGGKEKLNRFFLLLLTVLILAFFIIPSQHYMTVSYKAGGIATSDIRATQDYLLEDRPLTEKKRLEAELAAPYLYTFNANTALEITNRFEKALALTREMVVRDNSSDRRSLQDVLSRFLGVEVTGAELDALLRIKSDPGLLVEIRRIINRLYGQKIVADKKSFAVDRLHGIQLIDPETKREIAAGDLTRYIDLAEVRSMLAGMEMVLEGNSRDLQVMKGLLSRVIRPNLLFAREATEAKKRETRDTVRPVLYQVKRGEMVVRVGERISPEQALKLESIFAARRGSNRLFTGIGIMGLTLVLFYFPYRFACKNIRKFNPSNKDLVFLAILTLCSFLVLKTFLVISTAMGSPFPSVDTAYYFYLFPFAAAAMLVRIIINSEVALVYCAICAPLFGIMFNNSLPVVIYALLGAVVGAHGVRQCKDRTTILTAGMKVSVVNFAMALSFQIFSDSLFTMQTLYCLIFAVAGGIINAVFVTGTIPLIENLFYYTTDIRLLEQANFDSPVLRELMVRAPGTYHHSVLVGNLVEAAAESINANPLLARVAAYYHDIGKTSKPLYFIENVSHSDNRHDRLAPSMSALILISHVKEGVELAKEHRLGQPIVDIIRQSHGTGLITYFYQKAKNLAAHEGKGVDEREFRYPGPKPQTREAGLVLLADHVEAASRTLANPTPARIQGMVQKIINNIFIDGQLDECELTLKNLHEIAKSFNRILAGIYHQRIEYPEPAFKEKEKVNGGKRAVESSDNEPAKTPTDRPEDVKKNGGEDLKRLGISR
ncbi:MAG TPA: HDIG domain-containing protein [Geobacteraceae bacterium]|nr:HDIG domain-containing protein [Geobacteraceae bacterium]